MKKAFVLTVAMLMFTQSAFAILAPLNQGAVEIKAILSNEKFQTSFGASEVVQTIQKTESGYSLYSKEHQVDVDVTYKPIHRPGPADFELRFHDPIPFTNTQAK